MLQKILAPILLSAFFAVIQAAMFAGYVSDSVTTNPIDRVIVGVQTADMRTPAYDTTDARGYFELEIRVDVVPVDYTETFTVAGYAVKTVIGVITSSGEGFKDDYLMVPATFGEIAGTIKDSLANTAISGAKAVLFILADMYPLKPRYVKLDSLTTGAAGNYIFPDLNTEGTYRVTVSAATYTTKSLADLSVRGGQTTDADFLLSQPVVAVGGVEGIVTDSVSQEAVVNATVILSNTSPTFTPETTQTNIIGYYVFAGHPANANYTVSVSKVDYYAKSQGVTIPGNDTSTANSALRAYTARVRGTVATDPGDTAIAGARVVLLAKSGASFVRVDSVTSGTDGTYLFSPVPADTYRVVVKMFGFYTDSLGDSIVIDGENQAMNVGLTRIGRGNLHAFVGVFTASPPFAAIPDAMVYAVLQGGTIQQDTLKAMTDALGRVVFTSALEGSYRIRAYASGYAPDSAVKVLHVGVNDTGNVLLHTSTAAVKTVSGIVRNKVSGMPVQAQVKLCVGYYVLIDTAVTTGDYSISFPASFTSGDLYAEAAAYLDWDTALDLSATSTNKIINMTAEPVVGVAHKAEIRKFVPHTATILGNGMLNVTVPSAGVVSLYGLDGRLAYRIAVKAGHTALKLESLANRSLIARFTAAR